MLAAALLTGGCSLYRVNATGHPGVADDGAVVWSYAWGLVPGVPDVECPEEATLAEVTVKSHLGFDLLSVVTLGLVSPKRLEWKCTVDPEAGRFPHAEASDSANSNAENGGGAS